VMLKEKGHHLMSRSRFANPVELFQALRRVWAEDTASPVGRWYPDRPALNHCSVTSLIVQDLFGGELLSTRTSGGTHFYNEIDGVRWDLTVSQFDDPIPYEDRQTTRAEALADATPARYRKVCERLGMASANPGAPDGPAIPGIG